MTTTKTTPAAAKWMNNMCCLQYMEQLLINDEYLEFFVEGGRTRSGKPLAPKDGLLSVVVDSVASGTTGTDCVRGTDVG